MSSWGLYWSDLHASYQGDHDNLARPDLDPLDFPDPVRTPLFGMSGIYLLDGGHLQLGPHLFRPAHSLRRDEWVSHPFPSLLLLPRHPGLLHDMRDKENSANADLGTSGQ